jgi:phage-related protein (TIGR01555 family)
MMGLPRRFVDAIAEEVIKHHPTIKINASQDESTVDYVNDFNDYVEATGFLYAYPEVVRLARCYGGGAIVMFINDGQDADQPVNYRNIKGISGMVALSRYELRPFDYSVMDYAKPEFYQITTHQKLEEGQRSPYFNLKIHSSRIARFDGLYLPWRMRQQNEGWGQSCLDLLWTSWRRYESAIAGLEAGIKDASVFFHKIPGLMNIIKDGGEADIMKRLEVNKLARAVYGGMALDSTEEIGFSERSLANLGTASAPFAEYLQACTGWPASILMGTSPGGLGKEGRFEERVWAGICERWQNNYCERAVKQIFSIMMLSKESPVATQEVPSWKVLFPSTFVQTELEKAEERAKVAEGDNTYYNIGALHPLEIRQNRFGSPEFSSETTLDEQITQQLAIKQNAQFESEILGLAADMDATMNPPIPGEVGGGPDPEAAPEGQGAPGAAPSGPKPAPEAGPKPSRKDRLDAISRRFRTSGRIPSTEAAD